MNKLITIAIPTYKRPLFLKKALNSIFSQECFLDRVTVLVVDDSCDATNEDVEAWSLSLGYLDSVRWVKNDRNLGIDENIVKCIKLSDTPYVWLLGEDDLVLSGALGIVIPQPIEKQLNFYFANYTYTNSDHTKLYSKDVVSLSNMAGGVIPFDVFATNSIHYIGFIGGCILNREAWMDTDYEKYKGSFYSHVGGIIDASIGHNVYVFSENLVLNRAEDVSTFTWSSSTFSVYHSFFQVLQASKLRESPDLLNASTAAARSLFNVDSFVWLAAKRADRVYNLAIYREFYCNRGFVFSFPRFLLALVPVVAISWLRRLHLKRKFM